MLIFHSATKWRAALEKTLTDIANAAEKELRMEISDIIQATQTRKTRITGYADEEYKLASGRILALHKIRD